MSEKRKESTDTSDQPEKKARECSFDPTFLNDKPYTVVTAAVGSFYANSKNTPFEPWSNWAVEFHKAMDPNDSGCIYFFDKYDRSNVFTLIVHAKFEDDDEWELLYRINRHTVHIFGRRTGDRFVMDGPGFKMVLSSIYSQPSSSRMIARASECAHTIACAVSSTMAQIETKFGTRFPDAVLGSIATTVESKWRMSFMINRTSVRVLIDKSPSAFIDSEPASCVMPDKFRCCLKAEIMKPSGSHSTVNEIDVDAMIDAIDKFLKITDRI